MKQTVQLGALSAANIGIAFLFQWYVLTQLGPGPESDALFAGMTIPQLVLAVISGSLMHVLVPILAGESEDRLRHDAWGLLVLVGGLFGLLATALYAAAPWWISARFCLVGSVDPANPASLTDTEPTQWANEGVVELWGQRSNMPEVLSAAHLVVLPSYREGLPKVLLEAAACGRAVVTSDVPGCRDAIDPGVTGVLVPVRNAEVLAEAIKGLINDPVRCQAMGKAGRALAERAFDVRQVVAAHLRIYQELIDKS